MPKRLGASFLLFTCLARLAFAQASITGKITGVVTDASGAIVSGAKVTANGAALMSPRTTLSQSDGSYLFDLLPPGSYEVSVAAVGFKLFAQKGVVLTAGFTATVNGHLEVGAAQEVVTVTAESPAVDVKGTVGSTTFDQNLLQDIPSGRDPWSTVAQAPGATISTVDVGGNQSYQQSTMQVHGSTPGEQLFSFNGLDLNWPGSNGGYTQFYTDHDALDEFQLVSDNAPASVPIGGVYMNMVTKSGSNQLHGQAAAYYATAGLQASPQLPTFGGRTINAGSPIVMDRDTSANLGGPLIKDRWWLFGSYRRYDLREDVLAVRQLNGQPTVDSNHQTNTSTRSDWQINSRNRASFVWLYNEQNRFFRRDTGYQFVTPEASWLQIEPAYVLEGLWTSQLTQKLLWQNLVVSASYYHRHKSNLIGRENQAYTPADFTPITVLNGQPIMNPLMGQPLTLHSLAPALVGKSNYVVTNIPALDTNAYNGVEFSATKRMSSHWMLLCGFTVQREKGTLGLGGSDEALSDDFNDPNLNINRQNNYLNMDSTYVFKADSSYELPLGFGASVNFQHYTGFPIRPTQVFSGPELAQRTETVILEPAGLGRLPAVNLLNLRISRTFVWKERYHLQPMIDLFNLTNAQTVVSEVTSYGPNYLRPSNTVNPRLARIGMKFDFY